MHEIDRIIESDSIEAALEIKSSTTINPNFFKGPQFWQDLTGAGSDHSVLIYGGTETQRWSKGTVIGWKEMPKIFER